MGTSESKIDQELDIAIQTDNLNEVKRCHQAGANINKFSNRTWLGKTSNITLLCVAIESHHPDGNQANLNVIKYLVEHGININEKPNTSNYPDHGNNAIRCAIKSDRIDVFKYFVDSFGFYELDTVYQTHFHHSILQDVICFGSFDMIQYVVTSCTYFGCPTIKSLEVFKFLDVSSRFMRSHIGMIKFMLENEAGPNDIDPSGNTPLINIIDYHATSSRIRNDMDGFDPHLRVLIMNCWLAKIILLLSYGADITAKNREGQTLRDIAESRHFDAIVKYIDGYTTELVKGAI